MNVRVAEASAVRVEPVSSPLTGHARPPGSKSLTNRALPLAAMARGVSHLSGALKSDDTRYMAAALRQMGVEISEPDETGFVISGSGALKPPSEPLFLGNAGTAVRFLTALTALVPGDVTVTGDAHMQKRPIAPLIAALQALGVRAEAPTGCPPVKVQGSGHLPGGAVTIDANLSSQYISAILMAAGCADAPVSVQLSGEGLDARGYVDLTLASMRAFGGEVRQTGETSWDVQPSGYRAADVLIEPDASAATYLWAAGQLTGGRIDIGLAPEDFSQPDARAWDIISAFPHMPDVIDGSQMQDAIPTLAVMAAFNAKPVRFVGIHNLRVKECDRIAALSGGLNLIRPGLAGEEGDDLIVMSDPALTGSSCTAHIPTYADHRIAMSFALAGLCMHGVTILDPGCVAKTWPGYWDTLAELGVGLHFTD
ncbi:3-phosphoshikimate 1-carboxyvinyltransferase [Acetobacter sp. AN02]|uniref:3-phosphoshikimate 1-carboxyvinyltransferase n=1 Tax=Acetobacter sp. AN02 TaxID=2894186 RepID=UPI00243425E1|nr:3-phosphoshikimate 1-carboxyvinyltransferase [Acetobacter sp. AN02]MDG6095329.1 3-phosphoshikimate 1-carboxyvinyltransferase [Acetobacter sp. AN02]